MEGLLKRVYNSRRTCVSLKLISHASVVICAVSYILVLVSLFLSEPTSAVKVIFASGAPFLIVSIARRIINAPRPYELYGFYTVFPKDKRGRSFPSRHVFSAFLVAGFAYTLSFFLSLALVAVGICLAASRVLLGMHFIRDALAGALIGLLSAVLGIIILF